MPHDLLEIGATDLKLAIYAANRTVQDAIRDSTLSSEISAVCKLYSTTGKLEDCAGAFYRLVRRGTRAMQEDIEICRAAPVSFQEHVDRLRWNYAGYPSHVDIITFMAMT